MEEVLKAKSLIAEGRRAEAAGNLAVAIDRYRAAVSAAPQHAPAYLNLAIALEQAGNPVEAAGSYEKALEADGGDPHVCYNFARFLFMRGNLVRARELIEGVLHGPAAFADAWILLSVILEKENRGQDAANALGNALDIDPLHRGALRNYALLLMQQGRLQEAEQAWQRLIGLEPNDPALRCHLGNVLADAGRLEEAASQYAAAAGLDPSFLEARRSLCMLDCERGAPARAVRGLETLLAQQPDYVAGYLSLAAASVALHDFRSSASALRRALELDPACVEALVRLGDLQADASAANYYRKAASLDPENVRARWCSAIAHLRPVWPDEATVTAGRTAFAAALEDFARWLAEGRLPRGIEAVGAPPPFALAYDETANRSLLERHGKLCTDILSAWRKERPTASARRASERLRIGVVSAYFWDHSVWNAITRGWFEVMDRARFELEAFHVGFERDHETRRAESLAAHFEQGSSSLSHWANAIAGRNPDVLLYPEIGMDGMTLKLASLRLAPLQVASWGHPETTGLPTIDAYLSAQGMEPEGAEANYSEKLVKLPGLGCWYPRRSHLTQAPELPGLDLDERIPLLVCPGTPFKYAPAYDRLLVDIAAALGECRFLFFSYRVPRHSLDLEARLARAFAERGLDAGRFVRFVPWQTPAGFRGIMSRAHAFLDTAGFSGFNTAMEALHSGLPIVAWEGRFLRGRFASAILERLGLDELVARDPAKYVALAVALCRDPAFSHRVRERIEATRGVLYEDPTPVRALEAFLERAAQPRR